MASRLASRETRGPTSQRRAEFRARLAPYVFAAGLAINVLVLVAFLLDPFGWTDGQAEAGTEYVLFLDDAGDAAEWNRFRSAYANLEVTHIGERFGTVGLRVGAPVAPTVAALRAQPFASLVTRGGTAICR